MTGCFILALVMLCNQGCFAQSVFFSKLTAAAIDLTYDTVDYDPSYFMIPYPNGDVPKGKGVCTDVIIRAYRKVGIDLQQRIHEDMKDNFHLYPKIWGLISTDKNIDHRRVPNLMTFFARNGNSLKLSSIADDYQPGDIVTWILKSGVPHIGILVNRKSKDGVRNMVVHNIGNGQEITDCLFVYKITGHYRYPAVL
jgi:uncharacterized protein